MYHITSKWLSACLVFAVLSSTTCVNTTDKTTSEQMEMEKSTGTRDVQVLDIISIMNDCNETFRTEMSYVDSLNKSGSFPDETDKTAKCFVRCLLEKSGVVSAEGEVDRERAPAFFVASSTAGSTNNTSSATTDADFRNSTDACSERNETCPCEKSYQFVKCVVNMELNKYEIRKPMH